MMDDLCFSLVSVEVFHGDDPLEVALHLDVVVVVPRPLHLIVPTLELSGPYKRLSIIFCT